MSEIAEELSNAMINERPPQPEPLWQTAKGEEIPVSKLTLEHKRAIIKMLESKKAYAERWIKILSK